MTFWTPGRTLADIEKEVILHAHRFYGFNKTKTAQSLGIAIRTLDARLAQYEAGDHGPRPLPGVRVEPAVKVSEKQPVSVRK